MSESASSADVIDYEVIIGTTLRSAENRDLAIARAAQKLTQKAPQVNVWRTDVYGDHDANQHFGIGFNVEVLEDEEDTFLSAVSGIAETCERI